MVAVHFKLLLSHIFIVPSSEPETIILLQLESTTDDIDPVWPLSVPKQLPLDNSHIFIEKSPDPDTKIVLLSFIVNEFTLYSCPKYCLNNFAVSVQNKQIVYMP